MSWNEREQKAWGIVYGEQNLKLLTQFREEHGQTALEKLALMWAELEEEWLRKNRPDHILLRLLDQHRANQ